MTLNQLRYFVRVAQMKNYTKAAETLYITQSALSRCVRALEEEYSVDLTDHSSKLFSLTNEGRIFYDYAVKVLDYVDNQTRELEQTFHDKGGTLRIGIPPTAGNIFFHSVLKDFRNKHPEIALSMMEHPSTLIYEEMKHNKLDMGVVLEPFQNNGEYLVKKVCESKVALAVSVKNPLAECGSVSIADLKGESFLMMSSDFMFHHIVVKACRDNGVEPDIAFESSQWDLIYEMAAANVGIAFFPELLLQKHRRPDIKIVELKEPELPWILSVIYRKDKHLTYPMKCFLKSCEEGKL